MDYKLLSMVAAMILVLAIGTGLVAPRPAQANDLGRILAGAAVGYLVYKALDSEADRGYCSPYPSYDPPRGGYYGYRESPRQAYDRGYRDGWTDGERYGERRGYDRGWRDGTSYGYRQGWNDGYGVGYRDGRDSDWRGSHYSPPPVWSGPWCY